VSEEGSAQERTEEAPPEVQQQSRQRGQSWQSRDFTSTVVMAVAVVMLATLVPSAASKYMNTVSRLLERHVSEPAPDGSGDVLRSLLLEAGGAVAVPLLVLAVVGGATVYVQSRPIFAITPLKPDISRLNGLSGLKRIFATRATYLELVKSLLKVAITLGIAFACVHAAIGGLANLSRLELIPAAGLVLRLVVRICELTLIGLAIVALPDLPYQHWQWLARLRMSKDDLKRHMKQTEGDPEHKAARRRLHEEISLIEMFQAVEDADVLIVNPTHYAAALRYNPKKEKTPVLLAKGSGWIAQRRNVPIIRNVPLARALNEMRVNTSIPPQLYVAVVEVLRRVQTILDARGKKPRWHEFKPSKR
jgi:flagellar biosynthetic protein FlhB